MNAMLQAGLHQLDMTAPILTRLLLVALFPLSAFDKLVHWRSAVHQANARAPRLGRALVAFGIVVELLGFFCILFDWHKQPAALVLALFCLVTAFVYHPFWTEDGYWTADGGHARVELWEFLKDLSVAGGLLLYASMVSSQPFSAMLSGLMH
jgi:putative oxidoreductase